MSSDAGAPVGRRVERAAMDAADAAGREHPDPGRGRGDHRGRHRRRRPAALGQRDREARAGGLAHRAGRGRRQRLEGRRVQPDEQSAVADRHGRRHGAGRLAHGRLRGRRDLEVLRVRQAVADQRRLERDDRPALGQRRGDLGRDDEPIGDGRATVRACRKRSVAATLSRMPARRPMTPEDLRRVVVVEELDLSRRRRDGDRRSAGRSRATGTSATCSRSTSRPRARSRGRAS